MGLLINKKKQIVSRLAIGLFIIGFIAFSPILVGLLGAWATEWFTGQPCHEGNCIWGALGWLSFITMPLAGLLFLIFIIIILIDIVMLLKR